LIVSTTVRPSHIANHTWRLVRHECGSRIDDAAADLTEYLGRCADIRLVSVQPEDADAGMPTIHLGRDGWVEERLEGFDCLEADGFALETISPHDLIIAGPTAIGTYHGSCAFLETVLGVRWLLPGDSGEVVPHHENLPWPELHERQSPVFVSRTQPGLSTAAQQQWGRRMRLHESLCGATHSLQSLLPPATYSASHPQFFPIVDGERYLDPRGWDWHPCFSASGLPEELARLAIEHFRAHAGDRCFSLAISDGAVHCECVACAAQEQGRRNSIGMRHVSEQFFRCLNRVAELVAPEFPDRLLGGLAYANLYDPPTDTPLHPNLLLFHTYDRHKWLHPELARSGHQISRAWAEACQHLAWYDYTFGASFPVPRIYFQQMAANYRFARDIGVQGIAAETCHNWAEAPKYYLLARLQWDPAVDVDTVLGEWYRLAVGPAAAPHLRDYYEYWEQLWSRRLIGSRAFSLTGQQWLPIQDDSCLDMVTVDDLQRSRQLLQQAVDAAGTDAEIARASLLLQGFCFYEAAVGARLADHDAGRARLTTAGAAMACVDTAVAAVELGARSQAIDAELAADEVLRRVVVPWWSGTDRRGWGVYALWRASNWIAENADVRQHVQRISQASSALAPWARSLLSMTGGTAQPLADLHLGDDAAIDIRVVDDNTRLAKEPGEGMTEDHWQVCIGDDIEPFWNPPHAGRSGSVTHDAHAGRLGAGGLCFRATTYATVRYRLPMLRQRVTALGSIRISGGTARSVEASAGIRVEMRLWQVRWADHNPSPYCTVVRPTPGEWVPLALPVDLTPRTERSLDYLLMEIVVEGLEEGEQLQLSDVAVWPCDRPV
jgi:hypothetical protein